MQVQVSGGSDGGGLGEGAEVVGLLQRGGDLRAVQEPPAHGNLILLQSCFTQSKYACRTRHIPMVLVGVIQ